MSGTDRVEVKYALTMKGGSVQVHIETPRAVSAHDKEYILGVLSLVTDFVQVIAPGADGPEADL